MNNSMENNADITFSNYLPLSTWDPINISAGISKVLIKQADHLQSPQKSMLNKSRVFFKKI